MGNSKIEWCEKVWNPLVGCELVSPGCTRCYAARESAGRLSHLPLYAGLAFRPGPREPAQFTGEVRLVPERLDQPLKWREPARIFTNSMSDLFHPQVGQQFIAEVFARMSIATWHTFQVLTKRPQRMAQVLNLDSFRLRWFEVRDKRATMDDVQRLVLRGTTSLPLTWPLRNVWLGTSIESDAYVFRARHLRNTPAAVRFLSLEPLLGPLPRLDLTGIDWVITGAESGPGARPMDLDWVRDIRDRCIAAGVPFFFKQDADRGHKIPTPELDGQRWTGYPDA